MYIHTHVDEKIIADVKKQTKEGKMMRRQMLITKEPNVNCMYDQNVK
jgi:hypothetical protein